MDIIGLIRAQRGVDFAVEYGIRTPFGEELFKVLKDKLLPFYPGGGWGIWAECRTPYPRDILEKSTKSRGGTLFRSPVVVPFHPWEFPFALTLHRDRSHAAMFDLPLASSLGACWVASEHYSRVSYLIFQDVHSLRQYTATVGEVLFSLYLSDEDPRDPFYPDSTLARVLQLAPEHLVALSHLYVRSKGELGQAQAREAVRSVLGEGVLTTNRACVDDVVYQSLSR